MKVIGYIVLVIVLLIGITFAILNASDVSVNYFFGRAHMALSLLLVIAFAIGGIIGLLVSLFAIVRLKARVMSLHKKLMKSNQALEREHQA